MIERNRCIRCAKEYVVIDDQADYFICFECQRIRPHRLDRAIPILCQMITLIGQQVDANIVELNIDGLFLRVERRV